MTYKFKVEVYRNNPYRHLTSGLTCGLVITLLGAFVWMRKTDANTLPAVSVPVAVPIPVVNPMVRAPLAPPAPKPDVRHEVPRKHSQFEVAAEPVTFLFSGQTTQGGTACSHAKVQVCVITKHGTETRLTNTAADGSYSVEIPVRAGTNDDVAWSVEAHTPDRASTEHTGRQIITELGQVSIPQSLAL